MKLKELIKLKHWTREYTAKKLEISLRTLYYLVSGKTTPNSRTREKIKEVFGINSIELEI